MWGLCARTLPTSTITGPEVSHSQHHWCSALYSGQPEPPAAHRSLLLHTLGLLRQRRMRAKGWRCSLPVLHWGDPEAPSAGITRECPADRAPVTHISNPITNLPSLAFLLSFPSSLVELPEATPTEVNNLHPHSFLSLCCGTNVLRQEVLVKEDFFHPLLPTNSCCL